jgi:putative PIN family toxin of toxin-antitoxin system
MSTPVVFDCMVFLQAATSTQGPAFACVSLVEQGEVTLGLSHFILAEVKDVLYRPKVRRKFPHLTDERAESFLQRIEHLGSLYELVPRVFRYPRDPDDEPYINLAIASQARYLVTRDKDLLDLTADKEVRQHAPNLTILDPAAFLQELVRERQREQSPEQTPERERGREL